MTLTNKQRKLLAVCPKITGGLSLIGSILTIREISKDPSKRSKPQFRILVGMGICDVFTSFAFLISTWAIPKDSDNSFARGTDLTCNVQGFLLQFAVAIPLYNCMYLSSSYNQTWLERRSSQVGWEAFSLHSLGFRRCNVSYLSSEW